jgi:hypothetical protein
MSFRDTCLVAADAFADLVVRLPAAGWEAPAWAYGRVATSSGTPSARPCARFRQGSITQRVVRRFSARALPDARSVPPEVFASAVAASTDVRRGRSPAAGAARGPLGRGKGN